MSDYNFDPMTGEPIKKSTEEIQEPSYRCDPNDNSYKYTYTYTEQSTAQPAGSTVSQNGPKVEPKSKPGERKKLGFGAVLGRAAAIAAVCGLVGGGIFAGVNYGAGTFNNIAQIASNKLAGESKTENHSSDEVLTVAGANEKKDTIISTTSVGSQMVAFDASEIAEQCLPSIVSITNMSVVEYKNFWGQKISQDQKSAGSGIIVAEDGDYIYIATNHHVVSGAETLMVTFCDDTAVAAEVRGASEANDIAVCMVPIKDIEEETLSTIKVATIDDNDDVKVGEAAIAIGNSLGIGQSVTVGVISATEREVSVYDETTGGYLTNKLIQTDAAINPGNSGGALLNNRGEVIGINSSKYRDTSVEGMGFAIPMSRAAGIINELILREELSEDQMGYLGITGVDVSSNIAQTYGMPEGACIAKVYEGTGAYDAGLMKGDIIVELNGQKITSMKTLSEMVKYHAVGTTVKVGYYRSNNGEYEFHEADVKLSAIPSDK